MFLRTRLTAVTAAAAALAIPLATAGAVAQPASAADVCPSGVNDPGPFGPSGPYGPGGPYGPYGPLHGQANPIGNAAECGGLNTYLLRGGTVSSYVNANLASVGIMPPAGG
jgi:hypothetical protein